DGQYDLGPAAHEKDSCWWLALGSSRFTTRTNCSLERSKPRLQPKSLRLCDSFRFFLLCTSSIAAGAAVFLQLVVQGLQADTQNFSRAGLIVVGGLERFTNQRPLRFADRRSNPNADRI